METVPYFSLFIIGVSYGSTACMFTCMPFLAPLLLNTGGGLRQSLGVVLPFSLGRIFAYTLIAVMALSGAVFVRELLNDNALFQKILGLLTMATGLFLLYKASKTDKKSCSPSFLSRTLKPTGVVGYFAIGSLVSLNPCVPVLTLIALAANGQTALNAMGMGIFFGLGAVVVPVLFYGFLVSKMVRGILAEFKPYAKAIEVFASVFLIMVGILVYGRHISL